MPSRRQAIIWTNDGYFTDAYIHQLASMSYIYLLVAWQYTIQPVASSRYLLNNTDLGIISFLEIHILRLLPYSFVPLLPQPIGEGYVFTSVSWSVFVLGLRENGWALHYEIIKVGLIWQRENLEHFGYVAFNPLWYRVLIFYMQLGVGWGWACLVTILRKTGCMYFRDLF